MRRVLAAVIAGAVLTGSAIGDDIYEPNDTYSAAWDFSLGETVWLSSYGGQLGVQADNDWYEIWVTTGYTLVEIDCIFTHAFGDIDIALYDASGVSLASSQGVSNNEFISHDVALDGYSGGTFYILVYFDDAGNTYDLWWDDLLPGPATFSDLEPTNFSATPLTLQAGDAISFSYEIYNNGPDAATGRVTVERRLSTDPVITTSDTLLTDGFFDVSALAPGTSASSVPLSVTIPAGTAAGNYYFGLLITPEASIGDANPANNYISVPITVTGTPPTVLNSAATNVALYSATLNGEVTGTGGEDPAVTIYWGDNDAGTIAANWDYSINLGTRGVGPFSSGIAGLTLDTTYYYRCYAANSGGGAWASWTESFRTLAPTVPPAVESRPATSITSNSATLNGEVTNTGGEDPAVTIYWGDYDAGTMAGSWQNQLYLGTRGAGAFSSGISGLTLDSTYYFRCYAWNSAGGAWASWTESFVATGSPGIKPDGGTGGGCGSAGSALAVLILSLAALRKRRSGRWPRTAPSAG